MKTSYCSVQPTTQNCLGTFELRVLPFGTSEIKFLNLLNSLTDRTFENRWSRYKEIAKNKAEAYRVYGEHLFSACDAVDARIFSKGDGNMTRKVSTTNLPGARGNAYPKAELDYSLDYEYDPAYAHRLIHAGNRYYRYDANGNITAEKDGPFTEDDAFIFTYNYDPDTDVYSADYGFGLDAPKETEESHPENLFAYRRNYTWNEKNLLTKSSDRSYTVHYRYGEDGQRALKYTEEGRSETLYFNNFYTIHIPVQDKNNPQGLRVHKHIFVGNSRLVTAMTHTDNNGDNAEQREKRYYYHSDHLGSAQFVTDWRGRQYEHIEYTPYGELWIEEVAAGLDKLLFRFTGKEMDEETGLYYYGARYLDPKYSRWLSGDPALGDYIPKAPIDDEAKKHNEKLPGMGGVFNVVNLHLYHYAGNNPVKYTDPDGKAVFVPAIIVWGVNALLLTYGIIDSAGPSKSEHLARNDNQAGLAPSKMATMDKLVELGLFSDWGHTGTHNLSGDDTVMNRVGGLLFGRRGSNKDYRGAIGTVFEGCQFVYDSNGKLVTDSLNQGTLDIASPSGVSGKIKHTVKDVVPWLKWGNGTANNQKMPAKLEDSINSIFKKYEDNKISKDQAKNEIESLVKEYRKQNKL